MGRPAVGRGTNKTQNQNSLHISLFLFPPFCACICFYLHLRLVISRRNPWLFHICRVNPTNLSAFESKGAKKKKKKQVWNSTWFVNAPIKWGYCLVFFFYPTTEGCIRMRKCHYRYSTSTRHGRCGAYLSPEHRRWPQSWTPGSLNEDAQDTVPCLATHFRESPRGGAKS